MLRMTNFMDLQFKFRDTTGDALQSQGTFANGYGYSLIKSRTSYGGSEGLFEVAVCYGEGLCYDSGLTDDVLGYLTREDVEKLLDQIKALKPKTTKATRGVKND